MMRAYELMVIIDGDVEDAKAQSWIKTIVDDIGKAEGTVHGKPDWWGKRQEKYERAFTTQISNLNGSTLHPAPPHGGGLPRR